MSEAKPAQRTKAANGEISIREPECKILLREIDSTNTASQNRVYAQGKNLFSEGEEAGRVYIIRSGSLSLSVSSAEGRVLILRVAQAGELLGASSVIRNSSYGMTSTTLEPVCATSITKEDFCYLLDQSQNAANAVLSIVSRELEHLGDRAKSLLLANTATAKLAKLLLEWSCDSHNVEAGFIQINRTFTHEQIAQMIGSSRETVSRIFAALRRSQIIQTSPSGILLEDRMALENIARSSDDVALRA